MINELTPKEIVIELDRFIIGQKEAKKAVAIALRFVTLLGDIFFFIVSDKKNYSLNKWKN